MTLSCVSDGSLTNAAYDIAFDRYRNAWSHVSVSLLAKGKHRTRYGSKITLPTSFTKFEHSKLANIPEVCLRCQVTVESYKSSWTFKQSEFPSSGQSAGICVCFWTGLTIVL